MLRDYFSLAAENLKTRKLRTWLTMIGIFIGIAAIVSLISLGQGMKDAITSQFQSLGSDRLTIQAKGIQFGPPDSNVVVPLTKDDIKVIEKVNGVDSVSGRLIQTAVATFEKKNKVTWFVDAPSDSKQRALFNDVLKPKTSSGRFLSTSDKYKVIVGNDYSTSPLLGKEVIAGDKIEVNGQQFEIVGILEKKGNPQFDLAIYMNEEVLRDVTNTPDKVSMITVRINKGEDLNRMADTITRALRRARNEADGKETFQIQTPEQTLSAVNTILTIVQAVLIGIASISLLVGGIGIMNTMYTSVLERTKEIGIMKAIGAKNSDVLLIFLIESGFLGLLGGIIGLTLGILISKSVEIIATNVLGTGLLKASISIYLLAGALLFSFLIGSISGVLPAIQASKMTPVKALRSK